MVDVPVDDRHTSEPAGLPCVHRRERDVPEDARADAAVRLGGKDIFLNILTTTGLVQRFVTDALGPATRVRGIRIRLGTPCHAYDTLTFTGQVLPHGIEVAGRTAAGVHVSGTVEVAP